jgi:hypothetical protein
LSGGYIDPYGFSKAGKSSSGGGGHSGGYVDPYGFAKPHGGRGPAAKPKHGGGGIGGFFHAIGNDLGKAGHDIAGIPGGTYAVVKSALPTKAEIEHPLRFDTKSAKKQWGGFLTHPIRENQKARRGDYGKEAQASAGAVGGLIGGTKTALRHPLRDPFITALTVLPATAALGRVGEAAVGAKGARVLRVGDEHTSVNLLASKNAGIRLAQRGYDRMLQRALDREAAGQKTGRVTARVAKHAQKRISGAGAEELRIEQKLRLIPADMLDRSAAKILRKKSTGRHEQAALELTSTQTPPEAAAAFHYAQAAKGVNPKRNMALAKIYEHVGQRGLVHVDESLPAGKKVHINPAHERLAHVDKQLERVQKRGDTILAKHGVMTPEQLQERVNAPGRIRAGGTYEKPTPGKAGVPSAKLEFRRAEANRLQAASDRAQARVQRMRFTAADKKRIGTMTTPRDAATLREELRPLDKRLRQLTEEWNAPAKQGGQMTQAEAEARLAELDKRYQSTLDWLVPEVSPYTREKNIYGKTFDREQLRRNTLAGKGGKHGKMKTVKQEELDLAEAKLHQLIERHPEHPTMKKVAALVNERQQLHDLLNQRGSAAIMGEEPKPLPSTGGISPYEERAQLHRVLRKGTSAEKAVQGTELTVHGLNDLKEQAANLTDRINELRGTPGPAIKDLRRQVAEIRKAIRDAEAPRARVMRGERPHVITAGGDIVRPIGANHADRIGAALSVAKDRLQQAEAAAERRQKPTGIIGGETALPGRGFVSGRVAQKRLARAEAASSRSQVTGEVRSPIDKKPYTGRALEQGLIPKSVTREASQHYRMIARFEATDALRRRALTTGTRLGRRSARDVLIREPDTEAGKIGGDIKEILGQERSTVDKPEELVSHNEDKAATAEGLATALRMKVGEWLDKTGDSKNDAIGTLPPKGYRWVDENTIKGLQDEARPKGGAGAGTGRAVDNVNSAVTSLTVYFKVGHVGTRVLTNAVTNLIQGSLAPHEFAASIKLWKALSPEDKARMLAGAGQHGFAALPHEGSEGTVGQFVSGMARGGSRFWARRADAPFRFNGLAYELRKAGFKTPAEVKRALDGLESGGHGLPAHEWSKISAAARRADRELISYDRLNPFEKRYLTRGVWFYPWVKGSTVFTVRSFLEHPYKAAAFGALGALGVKRQQQALGDVPSYEEGLVALGGGKHPETTDFSTFSPFGTAADLANLPRIPGAIAGQFNPALGSAGQFVYGVNQYGAPSQNPYRDALLSLFAPTPEQQFAEAFAARHQDQSQRMFPHTPGGLGLRYLIGPAYPRKVNRAALARAAKRERSGQR